MKVNMPDIFDTEFQILCALTKTQNITISKWNVILLYICINKYDHTFHRLNNITIKETALCNLESKPNLQLMWYGLKF